GEPLVDEGVIGGEQIEDAVVLAHDAVEKQLGLAHKRLAQVVVEFGKQVFTRYGVFQIPKLQPLADEVLHDRIRSRIGEHAAHLLLEHRRIPETALCRDLQQLVVGNAAPEKKRQPRRQLEVAQTVDRAGSD